jgi:hypothetical protein
MSGEWNFLADISAVGCTLLMTVPDNDNAILFGQYPCLE